MRKRKAVIALALFAAVLASAVALALPGHGRRATEVAGRDDQPAVSDASARGRVAAAGPVAAEPPVGASAFAASGGVESAEFAVAARENSTLRGSLGWVFGGRSQRGWSIYEPLIAHTLGVETGADSGDFARALSRWQKSAGLRATGVLDQSTWMKLIATWQAARLKNRSLPAAEQLVIIPPAECYDPSRPVAHRQLERETYAAYRRMLAAAAADKSLGLRLGADGELAPEEKFLKIFSAHRSKEYQLELRRREGAVGTAALAFNSPHFTGRALDLYVGGYDPDSTKDDNRAQQTQTRAYRWLVRHAARFGFRPYFYEPWHWEYVGH